MGPEARAVLAKPPALRLELAGCLGGVQRQSWNAGRLVLAGVKGREMPADDLVWLIALEALGAGVPARDVAGGVEHVDGVIGDCADQQAEMLVADEGGEGLIGQGFERAHGSAR